MKFLFSFCMRNKCTHLLSHTHLHFPYGYDKERQCLIVWTVLNWPSATSDIIIIIAQFASLQFANAPKMHITCLFSASFSTLFFLRCAFFLWSHQFATHLNVQCAWHHHAPLHHIKIQIPKKSIDLNQIIG